MKCGYCGGEHTPFACPLLQSPKAFVRTTLKEAHRNCAYCGGDHNSMECGLFGPPQAFVPAAFQAASAPSTLARKRAPTLLESLFDEHLGLLEEVIHDHQHFSADERELALRLLSGERIEALDEDDRATLDRIATELASGRSSERPAPQPDIKVRDNLPESLWQVGEETED